MDTSRLASRLWNKDLSVFSVSADPAVRAAIAHRLGWLDAPLAMSRQVAQVRRVAADAARDGLTHVVLLGMGGSSLCGEVLRLTQTSPDVQRRIRVLDTTDERAILDASASLPPHQTVCLVASKSGSTIEVSALEAHFRTWLSAAGLALPGRHMIAITDPDTALGSHAAAHGYRHTFLNPADIGGRFSALSLFGLVPAALMGVDPAGLLEAAAPMVQACRSDDDDNPGVALGLFMARHAQAGRDKLTILLPPSLAPLGLWIEQLVAESTGKQGVGVLPIVDEPLPDTLEEYGRDRAFVLVGDHDDPAVVSHRQALAAAGHPVFSFQADASMLGAEFFRWEFATAVAGAVLDVNPFDEPNVRDAKARTQALLSSGGTLSVEPPYVARDGQLGRSHRPTGDAHTGAPFVAILDYLPQDARRAATVSRIRALLRRRARVATTYGEGPRYLHSTGQFHKGGTNSGMFLLLTADDASATAVPGAPYTFSTLKYAQALGDFAALMANGRHVVHWHIADPAADFSAELERLVGGAFIERNTPGAS